MTNWHENNPIVPEHLRGICKYGLTWAFANDCTFRCPYCFSGAAPGSPLPLARDWTPEQAATAWQNVYDTHGPCFLLLSGLEPTLELDLLENVLTWHYGTIQTNLGFDVEEFAKAIPPDRVNLHPTFHALAWHMDIAPFIEKVQKLKSLGYQIPLTAIVGYPPFLPHLAEWRAAIEAEGIWPNIVPMRTASYLGKPYPDSYTEEDLELLNPETKRAYYTEEGTLQPLKIVACAAGYCSACVFANGNVGRCPQQNLFGDQNLMRDGNIKFLDEPMPCGEAECRCPNLAVLHIHEGEE